MREEDDDYDNSLTTPSSPASVGKLSYTKEIVVSSSESDASLSENIEVTSRRTFHKSQSDATKNPSELSSPGFGAADETPRNEKLLEMLTTSFRLPCSIPLDQITETISVVLIDPHNESYGKTVDNFAPNKSNSKRGIENLKYSYSKLSFTPSECKWRGRVDFSCKQLVNSPSESQGQKKIFVENHFGFSIQCQTVLAEQNKKDFVDEKKESCDGKSKISHQNGNHYSIDIQAEFDVRNDRYIDRLKVVSQTIQHIEFDVSRALYCLSLPKFPEGCGNATFRSIYQLNFKLSSGSYGTVCRGTHRQSQKIVAIKCIHRKQLQPSVDVGILREVSILASLKHEYICPIIDFFTETDFYYIVLEFMEGGDVFDRIGQIVKYNEEMARDLCLKLLKAVAYCHENNIAHCDLKHKNLLLKKNDDDSSVMIADFGFASQVFAPKSLTNHCGTPFFVAPEIIRRDVYDESADMWSMGVIIYCLLSGKMPFSGRRSLDLFRAIISGEFNFDDDAWGQVSDDAKDLICKLLVTNPDERYTASEALNSAWFSNTNRTLLSNNQLPKAQSNMRTFNARLKLKVAILAAQSIARWKIVAKKQQEEKMAKEKEVQC